MRHKEPDFVRQWREAVRAPHTGKNPPMPRCCHTCHEYTPDGLCLVFLAEPPEDFAATPDNCPEWVDELPF